MSKQPQRLPIYEVIVTEVAEKALDHLPKKEIDRITKKIASLASDPRPRGCEKMEGADKDYRVRVGNYRIIYNIEDKQLLVLVIDIGPRKDIYRRRKNK
jgi:mRNA interferase RelE/StbE